MSNKSINKKDKKAQKNWEYFKQTDTLPEECLTRISSNWVSSTTIRSEFHKNMITETYKVILDPSIPPKLKDILVYHFIYSTMKDPTKQQGSELENKICYSYNAKFSNYKIIRNSSSGPKAIRIDDKGKIYFGQTINNEHKSLDLSVLNNEDIVIAYIFVKETNGEGGNQDAVANEVKSLFKSYKDTTPIIFYLCGDYWTDERINKYKQNFRDIKICSSIYELNSLLSL